GCPPPRAPSGAQEMLLLLPSCDHPRRSRGWRPTDTWRVPPPSPLLGPPLPGAAAPTATTGIACALLDRARARLRCRRAPRPHASRARDPPTPKTLRT